MKPALIAVLGPTASGKSAIAMGLAAALDGEIISCDSMQIYRGLDIGTAKPTPAQQAQVPHHLIDIRDPDQAYDVTEFVRDADAAAAAILQRGRWPILCGGTGLYAKALLYGLPDNPTDPELRAEVAADFDRDGPEPLLAELGALAPNHVARIGGNPRRLIRAVEIVRLTGAAPATVPEPARRPALREWLLSPSPEVTGGRIRERTGAMLAAGWIEETERLLARGIELAATASQAIGYGDIIAHLRGGDDSREALCERIIVRTRQYAKRQRTWFRGQHPRGEIVTTEPWDEQRLTEKLLQLLQAGA